MYALSHCTTISVPSPTTWYGYAASILNRIYRITMHYFGIIQNAAMAGFGLKEVMIDYIPQQIKIQHNSKDKIPSLVNQAASNNLQNLKSIQIINAEFSLGHGLLYLGTGTVGLVDAAHTLQWLNLGEAQPLVHHATIGLFLFANLFSLEQNIRLYSEAQKLPQSPLANKLKISAVLGMINTLGYILSTLSSYFPGLEILYLILTCLALFVGCVKIIYDFFFLTPELKKHNAC